MNPLFDNQAQIDQAIAEGWYGSYRPDINDENSSAFITPGSQAWYMRDTSRGDPRLASPWSPYTLDQLKSGQIGNRDEWNYQRYGAESIPQEVGISTPGFDNYQGIFKKVFNYLRPAEQQRYLEQANTKQARSNDLLDAVMASHANSEEGDFWSPNTPAGDPYATTFDDKFRFSNATAIRPKSSSGNLFGGLLQDIGPFIAASAGGYGLAAGLGGLLGSAAVGAGAGIGEAGVAGLGGLGEAGGSSLYGLGPGGGSLGFNAGGFLGGAGATPGLGFVAPSTAGWGGFGAGAAGLGGGALGAIDYGIGSGGAGNLGFNASGAFGGTSTLGGTAGSGLGIGTPAGAGWWGAGSGIAQAAPSGGLLSDLMKTYDQYGKPISRANSALNALSGGSGGGTGPIMHIQEQGLPEAAGTTQYPTGNIGAGFGAGPPGSGYGGFPGFPAPGGLPQTPQYQGQGQSQQDPNWFIPEYLKRGVIGR